ncbi:hypothetical protein JYU34_018910 [Plutella xylostella]|uniref:Uncharacterized protein n=1 Tax=Plutella xylostella TaxID=51655 RepID=A0ABQ7PYS2_PLUXY|nr:hypothetical protein JYU34_018910 [Plutella xylostella]
MKQMKTKCSKPFPFHANTDEKSKKYEEQITRTHRAKEKEECLSARGQYLPTIGDRGNPRSTGVP